MIIHLRLANLSKDMFNRQIKEVFRDLKVLQGIPLVFGVWCIDLLMYFNNYTNQIHRYSLFLLVSDMRDIERGGRPPMDLGDPRTPMAWQHRDSNYRDKQSDSEHLQERDFFDEGI